MLGKKWSSANMPLFFGDFKIYVVWYDCNGLGLKILTYMYLWKSHTSISDSCLVTPCPKHVREGGYRPTSCKVILYFVNVKKEEIKSQDWLIDILVFLLMISKLRWLSDTALLFAQVLALILFLLSTCKQTVQTNMLMGIRLPNG